jgi:uncharacterized protein YuzE
MAIILFQELIRIIKEHPDYIERWQMDVPAEQSLYIRFGDEDATDLESEVFVTAVGLEIVIDVDKGKKVHGIEIT